MPEELLRTYTYIILKTKYGYAGIVKALLGLCAIILPKRSKAEVKNSIAKSFGGSLIEDRKGLKELKIKFINYFNGKPIRFDEALDLSDSTDFDRRVYSVVSTIPRGEVRSYTWVAKRVGDPQAKRAVGQALARNKLPIVIPCHRVVSKSGDIGGYTFGVSMKRLLLKIEGRMW